MTRTFPALGPVTVVADPYVPRTITLDDGTTRPHGVLYRSTVFVGPDTHVALAGGSLDLVVYCLDCEPEPAPVSPDVVCTQCGDEWCGGGWECEG